MDTCPDFWPPPSSWVLGAPKSRRSKGSGERFLTSFFQKWTKSGQRPNLKVWYFFHKDFKSLWNAKMCKFMLVQIADLIVFYRLPSYWQFGCFCLKSRPCEIGTITNITRILESVFILKMCPFFCPKVDTLATKTNLKTSGKKVCFLTAYLEGF